jgi:hypothetical protein
MRGERRLMAMEPNTDERGRSGELFGELRHADVFGLPVRRQAHRLQEFFEQDVARLRVGDFAHGLVLTHRSSVVVDDLHVFGPAGDEAEAHAPLIVDADAPLPLAVAASTSRPQPRQDHAQLQADAGGAL